MPNPAPDDLDADLALRLLALRFVAVLRDLQRARGVAGAHATAHRLALHRERRALCDALGLSPDTGA